MDNCALVTVIVPVYNHEDYVEKALDSILMQKVDFKYLVYIGEDKSTDHTREVLKKIQGKYPENFIFIYREVIME